MKTKNIKSKETESWAVPGNAISIDDFKESIKKAEKGPFYTVGESKQILEGWRKKRFLNAAICLRSPKCTDGLFLNHTLSSIE